MGNSAASRKVAPPVPAEELAIRAAIRAALQPQTTQLTTHERTLIQALLDFTHTGSKVYSLSPSHPSLASLHGQNVASLCVSASIKLAHKIHNFTWRNSKGQDLPFLGFEYRRLAYAQDKMKGTNPIEYAIECGVYG